MPLLAWLSVCILLALALSTLLTFLGMGREDRNLLGARTPWALVTQVWRGFLHRDPFDHVVGKVDPDFLVYHLNRLQNSHLVPSDQTLLTVRSLALHHPNWHVRAAAIEALVANAQPDNKEQIASIVLREKQRDGSTTAQNEIITIAETALQETTELLGAGRSG